MSDTSRDTFDPVAVVVDWLDACRRGDLDFLIRLYDDGAVMECSCEGVTLAGRKPIADYWSPKLQNQHPSAFTLDEVALSGHGVEICYLSFEGKPVRFYFRFGDSQKIIYTSCGPRVERAASIS